MAEGAFQISRTIWESQVNNKPAEWFKIWVYIISRVNHTKTKEYDRGEAYFNLPDVSVIIKVKLKTLYNFIAWAKSSRQISTQKSTRGILIKVLNYDKYQILDNYKKQTEKQTEKKLEGRQKGDRRETIVEECKNNKNEKNISSSKESKKLPELLKDWTKKQAEDHPHTYLVKLFHECYIENYGIKPLIGEKFTAAIKRWLKQEFTIKQISNWIRFYFKIQDKFVLSTNHSPEAFTSNAVINTVRTGLVKSS